MAKVNPDAWKLSTGLPDDFDADIVAATFKTNPKYAEKAGIDPNTPFLTLTFSGPGIETEDGTYEQTYSLGTGWESRNKGKEAVSVKNPDRKSFNNNSNAGKLVDRIVNLLGSGNNDEGRKAVAAFGFYMTQADFYVGLHGHFVRQEVTNPVGGGTTTLLLPTSVRKGKGGGKPAAAAAAAAAAPAPETDDDDSGGEESTGSSGDFGEQIQLLKAIAKGKNRRQVKSAVSAEFSQDATDTEQEFVNAIVSGDMLDKLIADGTLTLSADGKTFA